MEERAMKRIMIVDDEQSILLGISYALKNDGVEVFTCDEIEKAEALLEKMRFDLVLADIRMSGVHGIEGLELLSYVKQHYDTKVIIMTGYGSKEIETDAYSRGAYHFFNKPIDIKDLLTKVSQAGIPVKQFV